MVRWSRFVWISALAALASGPLQASAVEVFPLPPGGAERTLRQGAVHAYPVDLRADEYIHLKAEQLGVDIELRLLDPAGKVLLRVDSPTGDHGPEELFFLSPRTASYRVEVAVRSGRAGGRYRIAVAARRPATPDDRRRSAALAAFDRGRELESSAADADGAAAAYLQAAGLFHQRGELRFWIEARRRLANLLVEKKKAPGEALPLYKKILEAYQRAGNLRDRAEIQTQIARCSMELNDFPAAEAAGRPALAAWRRLEDTEGIDDSLTRSRRDVPEGGKHPGCSALLRGGAGECQEPRSPRPRLDLPGGGPERRGR